MRWTCPECGAVLKLAGQVPAGRRVKCRHCGASVLFRAIRKEKPASAALVVVPLVLGILLLVGGGIVAALTLGPKLAHRLAEQAPEPSPVQNPPAVRPLLRPVNPMLVQPPAANRPAPRDKGQPAVSNAPSGSPQVGKPAPEIEGQDADGQPFKLSDYRGKVVVLDFWASW